MNIRERKQRLIAEINITPFTDVILVLLVIFMITTPLIMQSSIKVDLPHAASAKPSKNVRTQVDITITNENLLYLDDKLVTRKELKEKIELLYRNNPDLKVIFLSDKMVRFKEIVGVLDVLDGLGIKNLNIMAKNE